MLIGIVGYANNSGLGCIVQNFIKNLGVSCQLVMPSIKKGTDLTKATIAHRIYKEPNDALFFAKENKPDICIFIETPFQPNILKTLHMRRIKTIFIPMLDQIGYRRLKQWESWIDWWICPNKFALNNIPRLNKTYLPIPVDTEIFRPVNKNKIINNPSDITFLHVAGFGVWCNRKGTNTLIKAFQLLETHPLHPKLQIYSIPPYYRPLPNNINMRCGNIKNPANLYQLGEIYIAPSRKEGFGLSNYEAMACGLPILTTDAEPMNELIIDKIFAIPCQQKKEGLIDAPVCTIEPENLADNIIAVAEQYKRIPTWSYQAERLILDNYSWQALKSQWLNILEKVMSL